MKCSECDKESKNVKIRKCLVGGQFYTYYACDDCVPKDQRSVASLDGTEGAISDFSLKERKIGVADTKLFVEIVDKILEYTKHCSRCKIIGEEKPFKYIINYCILWKCTRCDNFYCYNCYEPSDGHDCFNEYEWPVGKGYDNITNEELDCMEELFSENLKFENTVLDESESDYEF